MIEYTIIVAATLLVCIGVVAYRGSCAAKGYLRAYHPEKVLILTAAVGGGHEAAGRALQDELEQAGYSVEVADGLKVMSRGLNWLLTRFYCNQVRGTPRSLGAVFAFTSRRAGAWAIRMVVGLLFSGRLLRVINEKQPDLVISTYPLVNAALERLRANGGLRVPAAAVIPDYGVHPLWIAPGLDIHFVASSRSEELAERAGGAAAMIRMPVDPVFRCAPDRDEARAALGIPQDAFVVLVVGGAWGIGDLEGAARCAAQADLYAVVVTGKNSALRERLESEFVREERVRILGWSGDLPALMAAADCLVQNAGGMTCIEAIEMELPIIMFRPILGHGELNCLVMEQAGVARRVSGEEELTALLRSAASGETALSVPEKTGAPRIPEALRTLGGSEPRTAPRTVPRPQVLLARTALIGTATLAFFIWSAFASSGMALAARTFKFDVPGYDPAPGRISISIRVEDPATATAAEDFASRSSVPITIFADERSAEGLRPVSNLDFGVADEPGKSRFSVPLKDRNEDLAAATAVQRASGAYPKYFLPSGRTNFASLADAPPHTRLVMAERNEAGGPRAGLLVVDSSGLRPEAVGPRLARVVQEAHREGLTCVSPGQL